MTRILLIDDDPQLRESFEKLLTIEGYTVFVAPRAAIGIEMIKEKAPDLVIMDIRMPGMNGLDALKLIHDRDAKLPVIIMTAYGTTESAIEAMKMGAFDYILKPFDIPEILSQIEKAVKAGRYMRSKINIMNIPSDKSLSDSIIGNSPLMQEVYKSIGRIAPKDVTVLIRGESGTGKELVARAVYQYSLRSERPFQIINCVAIPENLLESELFGYEKGAFTGAQNRKIGRIEQANRGTVFLDEIGDMPYNIQGKILRLLQERTIDRLGGRNPIPVDVRIIAATNMDLEKAIEEGKFREDLYYRLKVVTLNLPPIRERKEDIKLLVDYFLKYYSVDQNLPVPEITKEGFNVLMDYKWPGNVRELANAINKAIIFSQGCPLNEDEITDAIGIDKGSISSDDDFTKVREEDFSSLLRNWIETEIEERSGKKCYDDFVNLFGSKVISVVLEKTGGNKSKAAKILGLSRPTLLSKIDKFNLNIGTKVS